MMTKDELLLSKKKLTNLFKQNPLEYETVLKRFYAVELIKSTDTSAILINLDILTDRLRHLEKTFPVNTLHAIAIKTNPLISILKYIIAKGFGLEAASFGELMLARKAGVSAKKLIYDAPVKNLEELRFCNAHLPGLRVNANTISELNLYKGLSNIKLGLRINMLAKPGSDKMFDVSQPLSKFGELIENRGEIIRAFLQYEQLVGLHIHVGSQINQLDAPVDAIYRLVALAEEIEVERKKAGMTTKIEYIDIGGGFPANYGEEPQVGMLAYVTAIKQVCPNLFEKYQVITEFGRFVHAHTAWLYSQINSLINNKYGNIALIYQGANLFVREVYTQKSPHQIFSLDKQFQLKKSVANKSYQIGGPLCFAGDFIDRDVNLSTLSLSDNLVVSNIGANTFSLYSRHCSIPFPKVLGYSLEQSAFQLLKDKETIEELIAFWE